MKAAGGLALTAFLLFALAWLENAGYIASITLGDLSVLAIEALGVLAAIAAIAFYADESSSRGRFGSD